MRGGTESRSGYVMGKPECQRVGRADCLNCSTQYLDFPLKRMLQRKSAASSSAHLLHNEWSNRVNTLLIICEDSTQHIYCCDSEFDNTRDVFNVIVLVETEDVF